MIRTECIWCSSEDLTELFSEDKRIPVASYTTESPEPGIWMPFNIQRCGRCMAHQIKTLGDSAVVYGKNHAYSYGLTLRDMCERFRSFVLAGDSVLHALEIGAGNGFLSDLLLESLPEIDYTIVDPAYFGNTQGRRIVPQFFESYECTDTPDTLIMSHVFEHFYSPRDILTRIPSSVNSIYLNFPDLETYVQNNTYHILNPEHTFFVENQFLVKTFRRYGFECKRQVSFREHSVFFHFQRTTPLESIAYTNPRADALLKQYYASIQARVDEIQSSPDPVYLWPCSMHSQYVVSFGVDVSRIRGFVDNCTAKHGTYLYGYSIPCLPFSKNIHPILLGGCFTREIKGEPPMS